MSDNEKTPNPQATPHAPQKNSFGAKVWQFIKQHYIATIMFVILVVVSSWFTLKLHSTESAFKTEKTELVTHYEHRLDSLQVRIVEFTSRVFSWSVRSEMMRHNEENLNQLVTVFVQESNVSLLQVVSYEKNVILISSDKKHQGEDFVPPADIDLKNQTTVTDSTTITVYTPISGLNNEIGLLIAKMPK
jgi:hypothetical protein